MGLRPRQVRFASDSGHYGMSIQCIQHIAAERVLSVTRDHCEAA